MTRDQHFQMFVKNHRRPNGQPTERFIENFGNISFEEAFEQHWAYVMTREELRRKIAIFERYLLWLGVEPRQSSQSESRYYYYEGCKFRFSSHVYPTGSMTEELLKVYDFAANPELIDEVIAKFNLEKYFVKK